MNKGFKGMLSIAVVLALLMSICALPAGALAESAYAATPLDSASDAQLNNINLVVGAINGYTLVDGEKFSFNHVVGDRSKERGYMMAENGRGVKSYAGGTSQVASTIYLAVKDMSGIDIDKLTTYGDRYTGDYVDSGDDAVVVDWQTNIDFSFINNTGNTLTINAWIDDNEVRISLDKSNDVLGYGTTYMYGSSSKISNIKLAASAVDGTTLGHNEVFSFNDVVGPRTSSNGYKTAINGRGVKNMGGGVAQVATSIWLAVKNMDDIKIIDKHVYGDRFTEDYVNDPEDAIITDYKANTDFSFRYTGNDVIVIKCYVQYDTLVCEISTEGAVG